MSKALCSKAVIVVSLALASAGAHGARHFFRSLDPLAPEELALRQAELEHGRHRGSPEERPMSPLSGCPRTQAKITVIDPLNSAQKTYEVTVVRPNVKGKVPVVIIVPSIEGTTPLEPSMASSFCSAGIGSIVADVVDTSVPEKMPSWGAEDQRNRMAILAVRSLIDFAQSHESFESDKVGLFGISLGGIVSSMVGSLEASRLKGVAIAVGGGNLPAILTDTNNGKMSEVRRKRMTAMKWRDLSLYQAKLRETVRYDPFYLAPLAETGNLLMVVAGGDVTVPFEQQKELHEALGRPSSILYSGGHLRTILSLVYFNFGSITDFFKARFAGQPPIEQHIVVEETEAEREVLDFMIERELR